MRLTTTSLVLLTGCLWAAPLWFDAPGSRVQAQQLSESQAKRLTKTCLKGRQSEALDACETLRLAGIESYETTMRLGMLYQKRRGAGDVERQIKTFTRAEALARNEKERSKARNARSIADEQERIASRSTPSTGDGADRKTCLRMYNRIPKLALAKCKNAMERDPSDVKVKEAYEAALAKVDPSAVGNTDIAKADEDAAAKQQEADRITNENQAAEKAKQRLAQQKKRREEAELAAQEEQQRKEEQLAEAKRQQEAELAVQEEQRRKEEQLAEAKRQQEAELAAQEEQRRKEEQLAEAKRQQEAELAAREEQRRKDERLAEAKRQQEAELAAQEEQRRKQEQLAEAKRQQEAELAAQEEQRRKEEQLAEAKRQQEAELAAQEAQRRKQEQLAEAKRQQEAELAAQEEQRRKEEELAAAKRQQEAEFAAQEEQRRKQEQLAEAQRQQQALAIERDREETERLQALIARVELMQKQLDARDKKLQESEKGTGDPALDEIFEQLRKQTRHAFLIGNSGYGDSIGALANPLNDASDMAGVLEKLNFQVTLVTDGSKAQIRSATESFFSRVGPGDVVLFYYAGHGVSINGKNYMLPIGTSIANEIELTTDALPLNYFMDYIKFSRADSSIVILDACRDNPFSEQQRESERGWANMRLPPGMVVAYGTTVGQVAEDGDGRNGVYTKHLLQQIIKPRQAMEDVFRNVRVAVNNETQGLQTPELRSTLIDKFYFSLQ